jgi:hypothetical protein
VAGDIDIISPIPIVITKGDTKIPAGMPNASPIGAIKEKGLCSQ